MGSCKKGVTPLLTHWRYVFLALTQRYLARAWVAMSIQVESTTHNAYPGTVFAFKTPSYPHQNQSWNNRTKHTWYVNWVFTTGDHLQAYLKSYNGWHDLTRDIGIWTIGKDMKLWMFEKYGDNGIKNNVNHNIQPCLMKQVIKLIICVDIQELLIL